MKVEFYKSIIDAIQNPIIILNETEIFHANTKALFIFGETDLIELKKSHRLSHIVHELKNLKRKNIYQTFITNHDKRLKYEISLENISTDEDISFIQFNPIYDDHLFNELVLLEEHNKKMFNNSPDGICLINNENRIVRINNAFEKLFNYKQADIIGKDIDELIVPKEKINEVKDLFRKLNNSEIIDMEDIRLTKNNNELNVRIVSYPIEVESEIRGHYIVYKNITKEKKSQELIERKDEFLDQLFNRSLFPMAILDRNEIILDINEMFEKIFKYTAQESIGKSINDLIVPDNKKEEIDYFKQTIYNSKRLMTKTVRTDKYGEPIAVEAVGNPVIVNNKVIGMFAMYKDIREEVSIINELEKQHAYFKQLFDKSPDAIALLNQTNEIININKKFEEFFEYSLEEVKGKDIDLFIIPKTSQKKANDLSDSVINSRCTVNVDAVRVSKSGVSKPVEILAYPIILNNNNFGAYAVYRDISDRKEKEERISKLVYTDNLTKAYNRRKFYHVIDQEISRFERYNTPFSIVIFDLDDFKKINDEYGHLAGDCVLKSVSNIINKNIRNNDWLFRWGGDEFIVLFSNAELSIGEELSKKLQDYISNYTFIKDINVTISCGVATYIDSVDELLYLADQRMYKNKQRKKDH
ncbi:MAG TPA: PAS domain S-box protein [Clostridia bacterium]|nr:PAS domain S-box protein [Clostridia bacterium]